MLLHVTACYGGGWSLHTNKYMLTTADMLTVADMVAAAEVQHEDNVRAAEGQHEKERHAKAIGSTQEPEAQGAAVVTNVVKLEGHHPNSTPAPPQSPRVRLVFVFILFCLSSSVAVLSKQDLILRATQGDVYF